LLNLHEAERVEFANYNQKTMAIYLDNSATTAVDMEVFKAMRPYFSRVYGNASSIHSFGQKAREAVDLSKNTISKILNSKPEEIIFTSGGSESDNLAIKGIIESGKGKRIPHIITSKIEHKAVLETINKLEKEGKIEVTYLRVDKSGIINPNDVRKSIKPNTIIVSIMYVNNETGVISKIREIGKLIEKENKLNNSRRIYFHTDAVQAAQFLELNVDYLHIDLMTLSAHKIYGPKGIGLLYVRNNTPMLPQIIGGKQENGMRAGTENVASIVGFARALEIVNKNKIINSNKIKKLRDYFELRIIKEIKNIIVNGDKNQRIANVSNISFIGAEGESIILSLDLGGIAVSSGSACTSGSLEPSHVLTAMGIKPLIAQSSIRFSFGKSITKKEIDLTIVKLKKIILRLRKISAI